MLLLENFAKKTDLGLLSSFCGLLFKILSCLFKKFNFNFHKTSIKSRVPCSTADCGYVFGRLNARCFKQQLLGKLTIRGEGRIERVMDPRFDVLPAVMRALRRTVVVKRKLSWKAKLSIYCSIYVPTLTYGHELWVVTERMRSRIQAAKMSFLCGVSGLSLRDRVRSSNKQREL